MGLLDNKRIVVTGAGRGLGRAYAMAMAAEGAKVVVNDVDAAEAEKVVGEIAERGGKAIPNADSVADWRGAGRLIAQCVEAFGGIDCLVNNAGIHHNLPIWQETTESLDQMLAVNVRGTFNPTRHALDHMMPQRHGCIINVTSGSQSGILSQSVYGASKGAVASFTYNWAMELAAYNIRVNAISPMAATRMADNSRAKGFASPTFPQWPPEHVAPIAVFLASDDAANVTGQIVRLEGDTLSLLSHPKMIAPAVFPGGWTVADIRKHFHSTLGQRLEPVGLRAKTYQYYDGLTQQKS
ncbi:MAG: SDR family NAD(P)-dependent oxidoreductase [Chloroflexi bacterium]|nr:SDR family NAD(P)-dependent oxidoreductase [Chloroflexota bacterium]